MSESDIQSGTCAESGILKNEDNCIMLDDEDDDEVRIIEEPKQKRARTENSWIREQQHSPIPEDPKTNKEPILCLAQNENNNKKTTANNSKLNSYNALLEKLELYIRSAINSNVNLDRKLLDALLGAINVQVQKVVEVIIEHDPDVQLSRLINRLFGEDRPKLTENERKERQLLKTMHPAPHMTKLLVDLGQDLVQESTYYDIVHAKNLPEMPKNMDTYKQVAAQLKPVWEGLRAKNDPFKLKVFICQVCNFKTDSRTVLNSHRQTLHFIGRRFQCTFCSEFDTNEYRITKHIIEEHGVRPILTEPLSIKMQCPICEEEFHYKGQRDSHLRLCRRDMHKLRTIQAGFSTEHITVVNRWLWEKPPSEPSILAQQQEAQRQQQSKQQQLVQQRGAILPPSLLQSRTTAMGRMNGSAGSLKLNAQQQQQYNLAQQKLKMIAQLASSNPTLQPSVGQILRFAREKGQNLTPQMIQAAMQATLIQQQQKLKSQHILTAAAAAKIPVSQKNTVVNRSLSSSNNIVAKSAASSVLICEICDTQMSDRDKYRVHLQTIHKQLVGKQTTDMGNGAPLACSRCRERFWTYEGLERHLVMAHGLVTSDLLGKAQKKGDAGRCKLCGKVRFKTCCGAVCRSILYPCTVDQYRERMQFAFNLLQHLVSDHQVKLCSAEIMYSCDVCSYRCSSYQKLEKHLADAHSR